MKIGTLVGKYIALRDKKKAIAEKHKEELAPYNDALHALEGMFAKHMLDHGEDSIHAEEGTAYVQERTSSKVDDWAAFIAFVREKDAWHLLEQRAAKSPVVEALEEGIEVPGVTIRRETVVNVRRKS